MDPENQCGRRLVGTSRWTRQMTITAEIESTEEHKQKTRFNRKCGNSRRVTVVVMRMELNLSVE